MNTNTEREELAQTITNADTEYFDGVPNPAPTGRSLAAADAILAAGYRKPRTITTVEELDALPEGSIVLSGGTIPRIKSEDGHWLGDGIDVDGGHIIRYTRFATALYTPESTR